MARIPVYTQGISARQGGLGPGPTGNLPTRITDAALMSQVAESAVALGGQYLDAKKKKEEEDGAAWSAEQLSKARLDWTKQQIDREQNAPAGAKDYAGTLQKDFDEYSAGLIQSAPTDSARKYMQQRLADMKTSVVERGMRFEANSRLNDRMDKIGSAVDNARIAVDLDPSQYQSALAENLATLSALDIPEDKKRELAQGAQQSLSFASVSSRLRSNPNDVLRQLADKEGGGAMDVRALNADNRLRLRNQAEAELRQREAEAKQAAAINRAEMGFRLQDAQAAYMQGLQYENPPTAAELVATYGPDKGQQVFTQLTKAQSFGNDVKEFATLPIDQRMDWLKERQPGASGVAGEGFAQDIKLYGQLVQNAQSMNKQLLEDGAGYAIKYAPEVSAAWQGVQDATPENSASAYQAYAEAVKGEQARLGIPQATVLPASYVSQISAAFKDPQNAGARQQQMINEMQANWGQHYPDVFRQVSAQVPDSVKIIGAGVDSDTATLLSGISAIDTKELKAPLLGPDVSAMNESLKTELADFGKTFAAQQGGSSTYNSIYNEAYRGALKQMASGVSPQEAAADMAKRLSANYQFDGSLRVPVEYDIDTVQEGIQAAVSRLTPDDVLMGDVAGVSDEFRKSRFDNLMESATVVTNANETGAYLMVNGAAVLGKDGKPLEMTFTDLIGIAAEEADKPLTEKLPARFR